MKKLLLSVAAFAAVTTLNAQNIMSEDFENVANGTDWSVFDADGDTETWGFYDLSASSATHLNPLSIAAGSASWNSTGALTPDNFLISDTIDLSSASGTITAMWDVASVEDAGSQYAGENYSVYAVTDLATLATATADFNEVIPDGGTIYTRSIDISSLAGSPIVYLVFRHHDVTDMNLMVVDNISVDQVAGLAGKTIETSVYPNPANDVLNIVANEEIANVSILSLDGKVVAKAANAKTINVAELVSGVYLYEVTTTSGKVSRDTFMKK